MDKPELRFSDKTKKEYDLFSFVMPHQDMMQSGSVETMIKHLPLETRDLRVLEIGFGTGITLVRILESDKRIHLVAIDNEPAMMERAVEKLASIDSSRFELQTIEAFEYLSKQKSASFDAIISLFVLHNLEYNFRKKIMKEIYRVLKPGGIFVNGDKIAVTDRATHQEHLDWQLKMFELFDKMGEPELRTIWTKHYLDDESPDLIFFEDKYLEYLKELGFREFKVASRYHLDAISYAIK
jgi:tRNA (cmo5U34)-methyltransferase